MARGAGTGRPAAAASASTPPGTASDASAPGRSSAATRRGRRGEPRATGNPRTEHEQSPCARGPDSIRCALRGTERHRRGTGGAARARRVSCADAIDAGGARDDGRPAGRPGAPRPPRPLHPGRRLRHVRGHAGHRRGSGRPVAAPVGRDARLARRRGRAGRRARAGDRRAARGRRRRSSITACGWSARRSGTS